MSDDDILTELDLSPRGANPLDAPRADYVAFSRDLTEADIAALSAPQGVRPKSLVRIHASHHSLARCLASGMRPAQAGLVTGYSSSRISILQNDPAFCGLVEDYRNEAKAAFADLAERMSDLSLDAIEILQERLHDNPEQFTVGTLLDVVRAFADRTGHGPNSKVDLQVSNTMIDRPPRENFEEWQERRERELAPPTDKLN